MDALAIRELSTGYRRRPVIESLTLPDLPAGAVHALLGPNAAGKSTLLRALAGLLPAHGSIMLAGEELVHMPLAERARRVTYMPQTLPGGVALTVLETVIGALRAAHAEAAPGSTGDAVGRAVETLAQVGIEHLAMEGLARLSGGQRQLVSLAQALVRRPRLLLLDEPISALDLKYQQQVMQLVQRLAREQGMTVLVVLHDLQIAAQWSDRVVVLAQGRLAACGEPAEALTPELLAEVYHVDARIEHCSHGRVQVMVDGLASSDGVASI
ncbi:MAG TPA: ABC transporter ATP-binding protein [Oleiagrimonas sp.]|nr:ABC transporter ATP-binding protein [Oleiagrimonas sp.]